MSWGSLCLKSNTHLNKHWTDYSSWGIVESMNYLLLQSTYNIVIVVNFLFVSADKVTTINNAY